MNRRWYKYKIVFTLLLLFGCIYKLSEIIHMKPVNINPRQTNYTILAASVPNFNNQTIFINENGVSFNTPRAWAYMFLLPLTVLSWRRIGRQCVIFITIDLKKVTSQSFQLYLHVRKTLRHLDAKIITVDLSSNLLVRMSQILRLVPSTFNIFDDNDFVITSDADLWPLNNTGLYTVPSNKLMKIHNWKCCGSFIYNRALQKMYPLSHQDMKAKLWKELYKDDMKLSNKTITKIKYIFTHQDDLKQYVREDDFQHFYKSLENYAKVLEEYTIGIFDTGAIHGGYLWDLDQLYSSTKIYDYIKKNGDKNIDFSKPPCSRIDTWDWIEAVQKWEIKTCFWDTHVFKDEPYFDKIWNKLILMPYKLYSVSDVEFIEKYRITFLKLLSVKQTSA